MPLDIIYMGRSPYLAFSQFSTLRNPRAPRPPDPGVEPGDVGVSFLRPGNRCILWDLLSHSLQGWWCNGSMPESQRNPGLAFFLVSEIREEEIVSLVQPISHHMDNRSRKWARPANPMSNSRTSLGHLAVLRGRRAGGFYPVRLQGRWIFFLSRRLNLSSYVRQASACAFRRLCPAL